MDGVLIKIAFRNLKEHMTKTLIIGILITLGITILVVGNSFMDTIKAGIEKNYVENYTGNIFIAPSAAEKPSLLFSEDLFQSAPKTVPEFENIRSYVESLPEVTGTTGQINGAASAKWGELGEGFMLLFGINSTSYQNLFPEGITIVEGSFLSEGQEGVVISKTVADMFKETADKDIHPGDVVLLTTINPVSGTKIREVPVIGIHDYGDTSPDLSFVCFIDETNLRIMNGMVLNTAEALKLSETEKASLGSVTEDDLFGSGTDELFGAGDAGDNLEDLFGGDLIASIDISIEDEGVATEEDYLDILGDTSKRAYLNETDPNAWNFMLVKLSDSDQEDQVIRKLNTYFTEQGIDARAYNWIDGAGISANLANTMGIVFNILIIIVAVVAVIIIMNTLVISVSERYGEIGTMRAIGAKKGFVRHMIVLETLMITIVFGLIGVILGVIILLIMGAIGIEASNQFMQILLGGDIFRPAISGMAVIWSVLMVSLVGIAASLYPVSVALKVSPLEAMNKG